MTLRWLVWTLLSTSTVGYVQSAYPPLIGVVWLRIGSWVQRQARSALPLAGAHCTRRGLDQINCTRSVCRSSVGARVLWIIWEEIFALVSPKEVEMRARVSDHNIFDMILRDLIKNYFFRRLRRTVPVSQRKRRIGMVPGRHYQPWRWMCPCQ